MRPQSMLAPKWTDSEIALLRSSSNLDAAVEILPNRKRAAIRLALKRFNDLRPKGKPTERIDTLAIRQKIAEMPGPILIDRLADLLQHRSDRVQS